MSTVTKRVTTIALTGEVKEVRFDREYPYFEVANMDSAPVYLSKYEDVSAGTDGVYIVPAGSSIVARMDSNTVYVSGSGAVQIAAKYEAEHSFKFAVKGGEGGGGSAKAVIDNRRATADFMDRGWTITERGNSSRNSDFDILCYKVTPGSLIYIVAEDNTLPCKFVWQDDSNVREIDPNPNLVAPPVSTTYKGVLTVPEKATWICFSVPKNDAATGLYVMQDIVNVGGDLIVDTELSDSSPHPIANKTVTNALIGENLLINPDLKINQRGQESYIGNSIYSVDRWLTLYTTYDTEKEVIPTANGVTIRTASGSSGGYQLYLQRFENFLTPGEYTVSAKINGAVTTLTGVINSASDILNNDKLLLYIDAVCIKCYDEEISVEWVKLERGSRATAFVPPDPAAELLKCQRYYQHVETCYGAVTVTKSGLDYRFYVPLPVTMRKTQKSDLHIATKNSSDTLGYLFSNNHASYTRLDMSVLSDYGIDNNSMWFKMSGDLTDHVSALSDIHITVDAEIY